MFMHKSGIRVFTGTLNYCFLYLAALLLHWARDSCCYFQCGLWFAVMCFSFWTACVCMLKHTVVKKIQNHSTYMCSHSRSMQGCVQLACVHSGFGLGKPFVSDCSDKRQFCLLFVCFILRVTFTSKSLVQGSSCLNNYCPGSLYLGSFCLRSFCPPPPRIFVGVCFPFLHL